MPNSKIPSPARSQGAISTPRRQLQRTRSVSSPTRTNLRLSSIIESYKVSPVLNRQSILNDNTDIEMPRRNSWWKKIDDNSRDVLELLEKKELVEVNNVAEEFDVEVLSQEKKNYTLDLPDSSDAESINSIVIPQRKLFTQRENHPQIKFGQIKNNRETLQKLNKSYKEQDKEFNIKRKTLFSQPSKPRTKPVFPAALLDISANKTANKTKEIPAAEVKGQVRSLFGGRPGTKRKNMFADFIVSESEEEISEIQPKVFGFKKKNEPKRRGSLMSRHSQTSSIDLEMDDWILLPSSTMMENQVDEQTSPVKRIKLSNQLESKNSEVNTDSNNTINKTKQVNKSVSSKNKSKNLSNINYEDDKNNEMNITPRNTTANNSRVTRSMRKSLRKNSVTASNTSKTLNNSNIQTQTKKDKNIKNASQRPSHTVQERKTMSIDQPDPDEDFTLEYDNDDNEAVLEIGTSLKNHNISPKDKTANNLNLNVVDEKNNFVKESSRMINEENFVEQEKSTNNMCENEEDLLDNKENDVECNRVSNSSMVQNNNQEISKMSQLDKGCKTNVLKLSKSIDKQDKNKSKSIRFSVENHNQESMEKDLQKERTSQKLSINKNDQENVKLNKSSQHFNNENPKEQEMESEHNESDNNSEHTNIEKANEATQIADNSVNEIEEEINVGEYQEFERVKNVTENGTEAVEDVQEVTNITNTDERDKEIMLNDQNDNLQDKTGVSVSSNVRHDPTKGNIKKNKSPEVILYNKTKQIDSFTVQSRNTSVRKTKSIIFHNKLETVRDLRKSAGFSDETGNSSAEASCWDSHRTTRKTLRQTFGKDFTPRKSLRALVMEKTAKLQANFTEIVENIKNPQANSTEYDHVQGEMDSSQEMELEEVEQNIEMVQGDKSKETIQIKEYQKVNVRDVKERIEEKNKAEQLQRRNENEQSEESDDMEKSENFGKNKSQQFKDRKEVEESEYKEGTEESEAMEEIEQYEEREMENSKKRGETLDAEEGEEESEVREKIEETAERVETEESAEKEEMEKSEKREEMEQSENEERDETEEFEERDKTEQFQGRNETVQFEERDEMEESAESEVEESTEREVEESAEREVEESDEREETEQSENEERDATVLSEEGDEIEQSADTEDKEESNESEEVEESDEGEEMEQSENEGSGETERFEDGEGDSAQQFEEGDETVPDDEIQVEGAYSHRSSASSPRRSEGTSLEAYLQRIKENNAEERRKMREQLRNSLKNPRGETFLPAGRTARRPPRATKIQKPRTKRIDPAIPPGTLPAEIVEDMKYRPPKRFRPPGASWITRRLYGFLETKLEPRYSYRARVRAERVVRRLHDLARAARRPNDLREDAEELKREMARLDLVTTHFDFYEFCREFLPREIRVKIVPDIVNNIPLPRPGVFSDILQ